LEHPFFFTEQNSSPALDDFMHCADSENEQSHRHDQPPSVPTAAHSKGVQCNQPGNKTKIEMHIDVELQTKKVFAIKPKHAQVMKQQEQGKQRVMQRSKEKSISEQINTPKQRH